MTEAKQLISFLNLKTPKNPKISASLKSINSFDGIKKRAEELFLISLIKNKFLAPPPVTRTFSLFLNFDPICFAM